MRKVLIATAAALALSTSAAFATPAPDLSGSYSVSETYTSSHGGPTITDDLGSGGNFSITTLTLGTETAAANFFTADPASSCTGGGCSGHNGTETDTLTITFSNLVVDGISIGSLTETATFTAKYSGTELACADGDGVSPSSGETDCLVWNGAADKYNGTTTLTDSLGNGEELEIILINATDWDVTPTIKFGLTGTPDAVPEPGSLGLLLTGLAALGLGLIGLRRRAAS